MAEERMMKRMIKKKTPRTGALKCSILSSGWDIHIFTTHGKLVGYFLFKILAFDDKMARLVLFANFFLE